MTDGMLHKPANPRRTALLAGLLLTALTMGVYSVLWNAGFINLDDPVYVIANPVVRQGLTWANVKWSFSSTYFGFYYPMTWISHMLDCQIYGLRPWGHHLTSVLLHLANTLLLFTFFRRTTGDLWPSAFVAALFAVHPLHVESVAWVAERKDVLSTFFLLLMLCAYVRYSRERSLGPYLLVVALFLAALMGKSMVVTAPALLLLLDAWPLGRMRWPPWGDPAPDGDLSSGEATARRQPVSRLVMEKVPLLALSILFTVVTFVAQRETGAVVGLDRWPLKARIGNALVSYADYLVKMVAPVRLGAFYPLPEAAWPFWQVLASAGLLGLLSLAAWHWGRRRPWLVVGWLWYLGLLLPVCGLLQAGHQAEADRYTYLPLVGIFVILAWGGSELARRWEVRPALAAATVMVLVAALAVGARAQAAHWKSSLALFTQTLAVASPSYEALNSLGLALIMEGRPSEAIPLLEHAVQLDSQREGAWGNLGNAFQRTGRLQDATVCYQRVLRLNPRDPVTLIRLGQTLMLLDRPQEALDPVRQAVALRPDDGWCASELGRVLLQLGRLEDAVAALRQAVVLLPTDAAARCNLALALGRLHRSDEADAELRQALAMAQAAGNEPLTKRIQALLSQNATAPFGNGHGETARPIEHPGERHGPG